MILMMAWGYWAFAGNRADINKDRSVDALDLSILANILGDNLSVQDYDLENVVVVAPQGADFDDPADAADWVASQSPVDTRRFVIHVTPGKYVLDRPVSLSSFTTLRGSGMRNTQLIREGGSSSTPYQAMIVCDDTQETSIEEICLKKSTGGTGTSVAVWIRQTNEVLFRACAMEVTHDVDNGACIWAQDDSHLKVLDSDLTVDGVLASSDNDVAAIWLINSNLQTQNCNIIAHNNGTSGTRHASAIRLNGTYPTFVFCAFSQLDVLSGSSDDYYFYRDSMSYGFGIFRFCYLTGTNNYTTRLTLTMCN